MKKATRFLAFTLALVLLLSIPVFADEAKEYKATENYETVTAGTGNPDLLPYGTWKAGNNKVYSVINILPQDTIDDSSAGYSFYKKSTTNNSYGAAINGPYKKSGEKFTLGNGTKLEWGFGTHPKANQAPADIIIDISAYTDANGQYKCDTFYSCVGLTNYASKGVYFQVYGEYGDGNFKLLANSEAITDTTLGEFNVDVAGVRNLKLTVITATNDNGSSACAWMIPCLFTADPSATKPSTPQLPEVEAAPDNSKEYTATENYETVTAGTGNSDLIPYGFWRAGSNPVVNVMNILPKDSIVLPDGGDVTYRYYENSTTNNKFGAALNGPYKNSDAGFKVGNGVKLDRGFGTHPKADQKTTYIEIDISAYTDPNGQHKCDTFYVCVGLTNTASKGVYFQIYGEYGDGQYKLLANSEAITGTTLGEFNVDVKDVKTLRLTVIGSTKDNSSSACAWMIPSLFKADPSATKPETPKIPEAEISDGSTQYTATENFAEVVWADNNRDTRPFGAWQAGKNPVISLVDTIPNDKVAQTTGMSPNYEYYTDSVTLNDFGASINGPFKNSGNGYTVGTNVPFTLGFGTHPKPNQAQSYIDLDVSKFTDPNGEYQCDTFYSCVGLTNTASPGVYFQVFADYGDGVFKHIANSTVIRKSNLGEFNVDITGVKTLRLVVISASLANGSSASAWLDPSVFKKDANATKPDFTNYDPSVEFEKEPVADAPLFTWPEGVERPINKGEDTNNDVPVGLIIGIAAGVLVVAGAVVAVILIVRKKKSNKTAESSEVVEDTPVAEDNTQENSTEDDSEQ